MRDRRERERRAQRAGQRSLPGLIGTRLVQADEGQQAPELEICSDDPRRHDGNRRIVLFRRCRSADHRCDADHAVITSSSAPIARTRRRAARSATSPGTSHGAWRRRPMRTSALPSARSPPRIRPSATSRRRRTSGYLAQGRSPSGMPLPRSGEASHREGRQRWRSPSGMPLPRARDPKAIVKAAKGEVGKVAAKSAMPAKAIVKAHQGRSQTPRSADLRQPLTSER